MLIQPRAGSVSGHSLSISLYVCLLQLPLSLLLSLSLELLLLTVEQFRRPLKCTEYLVPHGKSFGKVCFTISMVKVVILSV